MVAVLAVVICLGSGLTYLFKRYPYLPDLVNLLDSPSIYIKTNVNSATAEELEEVPYIGPYTAGKIVEFRRRHGSISDLEQLRSIKGIRPTNFERFVQYLEADQ